MSTQSESTNILLARRFFSLIASKQLDALATEIMADDFAIEVLPASLGMGTTSKAKFLANLKGLESVTNTGTMNINPLEIIDAPATNQVIVHAKIEETFAKDSTTPFANEYIFIFKIADGKIAGGKEFVDSKFFADFFAAAAAAAVEK